MYGPSGPSADSRGKGTPATIPLVPVQRGIIAVVRNDDTDRVNDVVVTGQLVVDAHVSQVVLADEAETTDVDAEEHAVLATAARDRQPLQLTHHLVHKTVQLTVPARIPTF